MRPIHKDNQVLIGRLCDLLFDLSPGPVIRHPAVTVGVAQEDLHSTLLGQPSEQVRSPIHCYRWDLTGVTVPSQLLNEKAGEVEFSQAMADSVSVQGH
jgi:hypothetical protein